MAGDPVQAAIDEGKIPESRRGHYMKLMARNPKKTKRVLASLEAVLPPPGESEGVRRYVEEAHQPQPRASAALAETGPTSYPKDWLDASVSGVQVGTGNVIAEPGVNGGDVAVVAGPGEVL